MTKHGGMSKAATEFMAPLLGLLTAYQAVNKKYLNWTAPANSSSYRSTKYKYKMRRAGKKRTRRGRVLTKTKRRKKSRYRRKMFGKRKYRHLKKMIATTTGPPLKYKELEKDQIACSVGTCTYSSYPMMTNSQAEGTIDGEISIRTAAGTEVIDFTQANINNAVRFKNTNMKVEFRNNNNVPIKLWLWTCKPKRKNLKNTQDPHEEIQAGLDDRGGDNGLESHPSYWPKHSTQFTRSYKLYNHKNFTLQPGEEFYYTVSTPAFTYRPDEYNQHTEAYSWFTRWMLVKARGVIGHDQTTETQISYLNGTCDIVIERNYTYAPLAMSNFVSAYKGVNQLPTAFTVGPEGAVTMDPGIENPET